MAAQEALAVSKITPADQLLAQRTLAVAALAAKDFDQAIASLEMLNNIQLDAKAGQKTPENELRILAVSYRQQKDTVGNEATLLRLLETYPSKAYWAQAISRQVSRLETNPRFELDLLRLMEDTDNLVDSGEIILMAEPALRTGLPADAKRVVNKGFERGVLGKGSASADHLKLRQQLA
jgi:hypothetical protein